MGKPRQSPDPVLSRRTMLGFAPKIDRAVPSFAVIGAHCLSMTGTTCRICAEHCDAGAIRFRLGLGGRSTPIVSEACNGCDACRPVCPVGAIVLAPKTEYQPCA